MGNGLTKIKVKNFRCLADLELETKSINVIFGPNGSGKTTFFDAILFTGDAVNKGLDQASNVRNNAKGILNANESSNDMLYITFESELAKYDIGIGFFPDSVKGLPFECLIDKSNNNKVIDRQYGKGELMEIDDSGNQRMFTTDYFSLYLKYYKLREFPTVFRPIISSLNCIMYKTLSFLFTEITGKGSYSNTSSLLSEDAENLWSALRNISDRRDIDDRYNTIIQFMRKAYPDFNILLLEQSGPNVVYGSMYYKKYKKPIPATLVSDGQLQMIILLTALFGQGDKEALIAFDEPDISLHPYAIAVFAEAVKLAAEKYKKQIFIATHSPVLISQFEPDDLVATEINEDGSTRMRRVSAIPEVADLLEKYATGSLYMSELIARQSRESDE